MPSHMRLFRLIQRFWAFVLLPFINLYALFLADPLYENITHIAYANDHLIFVLLWAFTCAVYLWCCTYIFMKQVHIRRRSVYGWLTLSTTGMLISVCIPYHEQMNTLAKLHVDLAMAATISYILLFFYLLIQFHFYDPMCAKRIFPLYLGIIAFLALLFLLMGSVCTWLEVLFVVWMGWLHVWLQALINK